MSFVPRFITHNASLKLLALVGAIFLWAIVPGDPQGGETLTDVPVRVQVADLDWVASGPPEPSRVQVRLTGPTREIIRLAREGAMVRIPVERVASPDTIVSLRRDWVVLPGTAGILVEEVVPGTVRLQFEEARSRSLPLTVRTTGRLRDELALAAPLGVTPAVARVRGAARLVDGLESIPLRPIDMAQIQESGILDVPVDTAGIGGVLVTPQRASVGVRVERAVEEVLDSVEVEVADPPGYALVVEPAAVAVTLRGAGSRMAVALQDGVRPVVARGLVLGMAPGDSRRVPVELLGLPELVRARVQPDSVTVSRPGDGEGMRR
jgi:YbbR domain-containing protein